MRFLVSLGHDVESVVMPKKRDTAELQVASVSPPARSESQSFFAASSADNIEPEGR